MKPGEDIRGRNQRESSRPAKVGIKCVGVLVCVFQNIACCIVLFGKRAKKRQIFSFPLCSLLSFVLKQKVSLTEVNLLIDCIILYSLY